MLSVGQIIRMAEGIVTVLAGAGLAVGQARFRKDAEAGVSFWDCLFPCVSFWK